MKKIFLLILLSSIFVNSYSEPIRSGAFEVGLAARYFGTGNYTFVYDNSKDFNMCLVFRNKGYKFMFKVLHNKMTNETEVATIENNQVKHLAYIKHVDNHKSKGVWVNGQKETLNWGNYTEVYNIAHEIFTDVDQYLYKGKINPEGSGYSD